ncbi:hypothetical protein RGQ29_003643 [Quercus rubra]|uniref:Sulfotransferase n=1 Tax=Quercus rubra TaxID=3512 RepID=A0AAN7IEF6_QUERU|nr:hypothetical protein RGQ29_003643 [Quercus rubra]
MEFSCSKSDEKEDHRSDVKSIEKYNKEISTLPRRKGWRSDEVYHHHGFWSNDYKEKISTFPKGKGWLSDEVHHYQGFWYNFFYLEGLFTPKSGTTWLKALSFAIVTRSSFDASTNPLLTTMPHECVLSLESDLAHNSFYRNLDTTLVAREDAEFEEAFKLFCEGVSYFGPYWDHVLGYWSACLQSPDKVLFLKYEDLKNDTVFYVKKMAEFMGFPFSLEEEGKGTVQKMVDLCSFKNLSKLEVNKSGRLHGCPYAIEKKNAFFRKGEIGDWKNHLTPMIAAHLDQIIEHKLRNSGLTLNSPSNA